jgi:hypothetical protein
MARDFYNDSFEEYDENDEFDECDEYEDDYECCGYEEGYEWTEEDSWDALTDGMYGDMPSNPMEYDAMMDALGY